MSTPTSRRWYQKKRFVLPLVALVLLVLLAQCTRDDEPTAAPATPSATTTSAAATTTTTTTTAPSTTTTTTTVAPTTSAEPAYDLTTDQGLCAADATVTNLELDDLVAPLLGLPASAALRTAAQDDLIRTYQDDAFLRACPARASVPVPTAVPTAPDLPPAVPDSGSVFYENCAAVRAAGAAPLLVGEPGYSLDLDGDGDGKACTG